MRHAFTHSILINEAEFLVMNPSFSRLFMLHLSPQLHAFLPTCSVSLHGVPNVAIEVIVAGQQQTAGARESHGGDATDDVVVAVDAELLVCAQVEQPAGGVVGTRGEGASVWKELGK